MQHLPSWNPLIQVVTSYKAVDTALHARQWGSKHLKKAFTATSLSSFWHSHYFLLHLVIFTYCFKNAEIVPLLEKALGAEEALSGTVPGLFWGQKSTWPDSCAQCPSERQTPCPRLLKASGARKQGWKGECDVQVRATHASLSFLRGFMLTLLHRHRVRALSTWDMLCTRQNNA